MQNWVPDRSTTNFLIICSLSVGLIVQYWLNMWRSMYRKSFGQPTPLVYPGLVNFKLKRWMLLKTMKTASKLSGMARFS
eukprot:3936995-Rhodomonas_salina.1